MKKEIVFLIIGIVVGIAIGFFIFDLSPSITQQTLGFEEFNADLDYPDELYTSWTNTECKEQSYDKLPIDFKNKYGDWDCLINYVHIGADPNFIDSVSCRCFGK